MATFQLGRKCLLAAGLLLAPVHPVAAAQPHQTGTQQANLWGLTPRDFSVLESAELLAKADPRRHAEWARAAEAGDTNAMLLLALAYRYHIVPDTSAQRAKSLLMQAAVAGNARARFEVADQSYWGLKLLAPDDLALVRQWLTEAADAGNALAQMKLGIWLVEARHGVAHNPDEGLERLIIAAGARTIPAMLYLGTLQPSDGPPRDYRFFRDGDTASVHGLDPTIPASPTLTLPAAQIAGWLRGAAEAGSGRALFGMALLHANGWGVEQDAARALDWHRRAVERPGSTRNFGVFEWSRRLMTGDGVPKDRAAGLALAKEFLAAWPSDRRGLPGFFGETLSNADWANLLLHDRGRSFDDALFYWQAKEHRHQPETAVALLRVLADQGETEAMRQLGFLYSNDEFKTAAFPKDLAKSLYWIERAAQRGDEWAIFTTARHYFDGVGTARNPAAAYAWLARAEKSRDGYTRERAAKEIAEYRQRDAARAEKLRLAKERADAEERAWAAKMAREQARIDRQNAEAAAAYQARANQQHALNVAAWRFYRPQFTGYPTLDAIEADRAWKAAQADVRFFEYCRTNNCYARSTPAPSHSTASSSGRGGGSAATSSAGASKPASASANGARGDRTVPAAASAGGGAKAAASSLGGDRSAAGSANAATTAGSGADGGTGARSGPMLTIKTPFVPEPPPQLPEVPAFVPTPRPPRPVATEAPCPGPSACVTAEARELTASERAFKAQMDAWYAANEAASAADAEQRKRIDAARAERTRISNEHGKRQSARRQACDAGDVSQCQP